MKKLLSIILTGAMCFSAMSAAFAAEMSFTDVNSTDWFYEDVKTAVEMGLVNGKSETSYAPADNLTYAEAIKLAACMNQLYNEGAVSFASGNPWYMPYVDYCNENGIIDKEYGYSDNATRAGYMGIFAKALPDEGLKEINNVPDDSIPDVPSSKAYAPGIYKLYRAGILTGVDEAHNCNPLANITRAEVAAILTRMMNEDKRVEITDMGTAEQKPVEKETEEKEPEEKETEEKKPEEKEPEEKKPEEKALAIKTQPTDVSIAADTEVTFIVEAEGGKAPYTYKWQTNRNGDAFGDINAGTFNYHEGYDSAAYKVKISQAVIDNKQGFRCIITDANGDSVTSETVTIQSTAESTGGAKNKFEQAAKTEELKNEDFEMNVETVQTVSGKGLILAGRILAGKVNKGDTVYVNDADGKFVAETKAVTIEMFRKSLDEAKRGDNIGLETELASADWKDKISAGYVVSATKGSSSLGERPAVSRPTGLTRPTTVVKELKIETQPVSASAALGETKTFTVSVTGGKAPYTYQWYAVTTVAGKAAQVALTDTGVTISGAGTDTLSLRPTEPGTTTFYCSVTDESGNTVKSEQATLTVVASTGGRQSLPSGKTDGGY